MAAQVGGSSNPEQGFRPFGDQGPMQAAWEVHGPSLQENTYMHTHALFAGTISGDS